MISKDPIERLREWVRGTRSDGIGPLGTSIKELEEIADMVEAERDRLHKTIVDLMRTHMKLPVDADGVSIRPGDEMQMAFGESAEVVAVGFGRWFFDHSCLADDSEEYDWEWAANSQHAKPDTVEDIIMEAMQHAFSASHLDMGDKVDEFAERIRKAVEHG